MRPELFEKHPLVISGDTERIEDNSFTFKSCSEIIIEEGVKEIGGWAFAWNNADKASIPSTILKIEENPFAHSHIFNVTCLSPNYHVYDGALVENNTFRMVSYVGQDRYSGKDVFELKDADNDSSCKFEYIIPSYIRILGEGCFRGRILDKITIPQTVVTILQNPFVGCSAEIINYSPNYILENGFLIEKASRTLIAYVGKEKDIVVPDGIEIIEGSAFELLEYGVNSITLPNSITIIRDNFGEECELQHIYVPKEKVSLIQELLPKHKNIINVIGANDNKTLASDDGQFASQNTQCEVECNGYEEAVKQELAETYKPNYSFLAFLFSMIFIIGVGVSYLVGCLCSWDFTLSDWNIFSIVISSILAILSIAFGILMVMHSNRQDKKDEEWKIERKHRMRTRKDSLRDQIRNSGGMCIIMADLIDALGYPVLEEGDNWIRLRITDTSSIKLEQTDWEHQSVTYYINENGKFIEQIQGFKTMGYMPMVTSREVIIQTIKEKIWNYGLSEHPGYKVKSENTYSFSDCLMRDLYIIAYQNEGEISDGVDTVIKSFAEQYGMDDSKIDKIRSQVIYNKGAIPAFILDCYPDDVSSINEYIKDMVSIYKYTMKATSTEQGYKYMCDVAAKMGMVEKRIEEIIQSNIES